MNEVIKGMNQVLRSEHTYRKAQFYANGGADVRVDIAAEDHADVVTAFRLAIASLNTNNVLAYGSETESKSYVALVSFAVITDLRGTLMEQGFDPFATLREGPMPFENESLFFDGIRFVESPIPATVDKEPGLTTYSSFIFGEGADVVFTPGKFLEEPLPGVAVVTHKIGWV